jgi:hypothetical protein
MASYQDMPDYIIHCIKHAEANAATNQTALTITPIS